jgi:hypothetical protein
MNCIRQLPIENLNYLTDLVNEICDIFNFGVEL